MLSEERLKEIRYFASTCCDSITHGCNKTLELIAEIDQLRVENENLKRPLLPSQISRYHLRLQNAELKSLLRECKEVLLMYIYPPVAEVTKKIEEALNAK